MTFLEIRQNYSVVQLQKIANESRSFRDFGTKLGYEVNGSTRMKKLKRLAAEVDINVSHFKGHAWNKGVYNDSCLRKGIAVKSETLRRILIQKRGRRCEHCGMTTWNGTPIPLQAHHEDGDRLNNEEGNLKLLCPNCHALTDNYCGKNIGKKKSVTDDEFICALQETSSIRQALLLLGLSAKGANYKRAKALLSTKLN